MTMAPPCCENSKPPARPMRPQYMRHRSRRTLEDTIVWPHATHDQFLQLVDECPSTTCIAVSHRLSPFVSSAVQGWTETKERSMALRLTPRSLARASSRHPWRTIAAWLLLFLAGGILS